MYINLTEEQKIAVLAEIFTKEQLVAIGDLIIKDFNNTAKESLYSDIFETVSKAFRFHRANEQKRK